MRRSIAVLAALVPLSLAGCNLLPGGGGAGGPSINVSSSVSGSLDDDDPRMRGNRGPYDVWTLRGKRGQRIVIDMTSSEFDAYLFLRDSDGYLLGRDDDGGNQGDARIRTILPRNGRYRIIATSFGSTARGHYSIAVGKWSAPDAPAAGRESGIAMGETRDGLLEPGDEFSGDGPYQDRWTFDLPAGGRVRIDMTSTDVDSYLILLGPDGQVVATNDDASRLDARILARSTEGGTYTVLATTFGDMPRVGAYRLALSEVSADFAEPGQVHEIADQRPMDGQLEEGDSTAADGSWVDVYRFRAPRSGPVTIDLSSSDFDPYLTLQDSSRSTLATDDDSGEGFNSQLSWNVREGATYHLLAGVYGSSRRGGSYRLAVTMGQ